MYVCESRHEELPKYCTRRCIYWSKAHYHATNLDCKAYVMSLDSFSLLYLRRLTWSASLTSSGNGICMIAINQLCYSDWTALSLRSVRTRCLFSFASVIIEVAARATHVTCLRFTDGAGVRMMIRYQGGGNEHLDESNHRNRRATSASIRRSPLQHCRLVLKPCSGNSGMSYHR